MRTNVDEKPGAAGEEVKSSDIELRTIVDALPAHAWCSREDGYNIFCNQQWLDYTGLSQETARGWAWREKVHPDDMGLFEQKWAEVAAIGAPLEGEARLLSHDGEYRWFLIRAVPVRDEKGNVVKWFGTDTDIDSLKKSTTLLAGENKILQMVAVGKPLALILDEVCNLVESICTDCMACVALIDSADCLRPGGKGFRFPKQFLARADGIKIGPRVGSCGTAAFQKMQIIVTDVETDPLWEGYRDIANQSGVRAGWSSPILSSSGAVPGVFGVYWSKPRSPSPDHLRLIDQITHLASIAIERKRVAEALEDSENYARGQAARLEEAQRIAHLGYWERDLNLDLLAWSDETYRIFGMPRQDSILSLSGVLNRIHPEDRDIIRRAVSKALSGEQHYDVEYRVIQPNGEIRFAHSSGDVIKDESGTPRRMFGMIQDITERKRTEQALRASEDLAQGQLQALSRTLDALAAETNPDRVLEHVLRTVIAQLDADSDSVWLRDAASGLMVFKFGLEDGRFKTPAEPDIAAITNSMPMEAFAPWREIFQTGKPSVMEDIREGPEFAWRNHVLARAIITILWIPILIASKVEGVIGVRFAQKRTFRPEELRLAQSLANQAMLAIHLARLSSQSRQTAVMEERNRMARDIHDTLAQGFTGVIMHLEAAEEAISRQRAEVVSDCVRNAGEIAREGLREARRSVQALRPSALEANNLAEALEGLVKKQTAGTPVRAKFAVQGTPQELPPEWDENILRIEQEMLTNVLRHAHASELDVLLTFDAQEVRLNIHDNGCGFDSAGKHEGFGLRGMAERAENMGGRLFIQSAKGLGTALCFVLPLAASAELKEP